MNQFESRHYIFHFGEATKAERDIESIAAYQESCFQHICAVLGVKVLPRSSKLNTTFVILRRKWDEFTETTILAMDLRLRQIRFMQCTMNIFSALDSTKTLI